MSCRELASALRRSTVEVRTRGTGAGSGIIWTADGLIVTNAHVARTERATIVLWDGSAFDGVVTARDPRRDLATIAIDAAAPRSSAATIGHPTDLRTGDVVVALGHPLGITGAHGARRRARGGACDAARRAGFARTFASLRETPAGRWPTCTAASSASTR